MVRHSVTINQEKSYWWIIWRSPESLSHHSWGHKGSEQLFCSLWYFLLLTGRSEMMVMLIEDVWALVSKEGLCCRIIRNRKMCWWWWWWWWAYTRKISIIKHCQTQHYRHKCVLMDQSMSSGFGTNGKTTMNMTHGQQKKKKMELYKWFCINDLCWDLLDVLKWLPNYNC